MHKFLDDNCRKTVKSKKSAEDCSEAMHIMKPFDNGKKEALIVSTDTQDMKTSNPFQN